MKRSLLLPGIRDFQADWWRLSLEHISSPARGKIWNAVEAYPHLTSVSQLRDLPWTEIVRTEIEVP